MALVEEERFIVPENDGDLRVRFGCPTGVQAEVVELVQGRGITAKTSAMLARMSTSQF